MPDFDLTDRVAIVTGGSRGIGEATAQALADQGARVVISSRKLEGLQSAADRINARHPGAVTPRAAPVGRVEDSQRLVTTVMERFGRIDILVNNAGTNPHFGPVLDVELSAWDKTFEVNLRGPLALTKLVVEAWMRAHGGAIVNVASIAGLRPEFGLGPYGVTKAALIMLSRQLATELGPLGIRVNAVAPSIVKTEFAAARCGETRRSLGVRSAPTRSAVSRPTTKWHRPSRSWFRTRHRTSTGKCCRSTAANNRTVIRAAVLTSVGSPLVIEDIELPPPAAGEVHVRLAAAGVCHSDLSLAHGTLPQAVPAVLGHEAAGTVITVGPGVTKVQPGAKVLLNWSPSCGRCWFCKRGEPYLCELTPKAWRRRYARRADGTALYAGLGVAAFGEETIVPSSAVLALPANVNLEKAALLSCAMLTGIGAVTNSARVQTGESVVVFGIGGVGLSVLPGARLGGAGGGIGGD